MSRHTAYTTEQLWPVVREFDGAISSLASRDAAAIIIQTRAERDAGQIAVLNAKIEAYEDALRLATVADKEARAEWDADSASCGVMWDCLYAEIQARLAPLKEAVAARRTEQ